MTEVTFGINQETFERYIPASNLPRTDQLEVYKAVGSVLNCIYEQDPEFCFPGNSLVTLTDGRRTSFSWELAGSVKEEK